MNSRWLRNSFVYLLIIVAVVAIFLTVMNNLGGSEERNLSDVLALAKEQPATIKQIVVQGEKLQVTTTDGTTFTANKEPGISFVETLDRAGVKLGQGGISVQVKGSSGFGSFLGIAINFLPLILLAFLFLFMMRQAQGSNSQTMSFGRSRARMFVGNRSTVTFADVAGVEEAKTELQEVVEFLRYPERFLALGARIPKGVLLMGPPGTGKTLMARAVAGEAGVPFFSISGSEFVEMFVGVGAARVRDLFDQAKRNAPCIVFVDEIDAVGRHRGAGLGGGHDEREQTLNQILVEMDGFDVNVNVIVIAATNRPDILDPALLRPGRFDRRVVLDLPDINGRKQILGVHAKGKPLAPDVTLDTIAKETPGFSGADLANLVNEAAILAARRSKKVIGISELEESVDRVIAGPERKSRVISAREKEMTAYHEAGHALVARMLPNADPVHKISIVSRGMMGGYTRMLPAEDRYLWTKNQFEAMLAVSMGGRVAEELVFNEVTTGASNDLETSTKVARQMVTRYAMAGRTDYNEMPISTLVEQAAAGNVEAIEVYGDDLLVNTRDGKVSRSRKEMDTSLVELLARLKVQTGSNGIKVQVKNSSGLGGLAPRVYGRREELIFLGKEIAEQRDYSLETERRIDDEVNRIINEAYQRARTALSEHRDQLKRLAEYLVQHESAEGEELAKLFVAIANPEQAQAPASATPVEQAPSPQPEAVQEKPAPSAAPRSPIGPPQPAPGSGAS
ncbi:MAG: ATP-dependent zinc metalloprotease FtsH [Chloroflexota bacterium]|nr:ATP-dependent zinc metalloprotease FtsH [Chloroflexota bacterium]